MTADVLVASMNTYRGRKQYISIVERPVEQARSICFVKVGWGVIAFLSQTLFILLHCKDRSDFNQILCGEVQQMTHKGIIQLTLRL